MIYRGSDLKINVSVDAGNGLTKDDVDFSCVFSCGMKKCIIDKNNMIRIDPNNYLACIKGNDTAKGDVECEIRIQVPDTDFVSGFRTEVVRAKLGDSIV